MAKLNTIFIGVCISLVAFSFFAQADIVSFGNKNIPVEVKKITSKIYETKDTTYFFLTKKSFSTKSTCGTDITAYANQKLINRIVSKTCTKKGRLAIEFYYEDEKPIFVYEVFEYFQENGKNTRWKNFKNISSWESRYYFLDKTLGFHTHKGRENVKDSITGKLQKKRAYQALEFTKSNIP